MGDSGGCYHNSNYSRVRGRCSPASREQWDREDDPARPGSAMGGCVGAPREATPSTASPGGGAAPLTGGRPGAGRGARSRAERPSGKNERAMRVDKEKWAGGCQPSGLAGPAGASGQCRGLGCLGNVVCARTLGNVLSFVRSSYSAALEMP